MTSRDEVIGTVDESQLFLGKDQDGACHGKKAQEKILEHRAAVSALVAKARESASPAHPDPLAVLPTSRR